MSTVTIQVARDLRSGFPCVRHREHQDWIALLPVTKLQVEHWLWQGGLDGATDAEDVSWLIERLELDSETPQYPQTIRRLRRVPIALIDRDRLPGILATNLSLWEEGEEADNPGITFPSPRSDWGKIRHWLGGRVPASAEWQRTLDDYSRLKSRELVQAVLDQGLAWPSTVEALLHKLRDLLADSETGLPFMNLGVYELVSDVKHFDKLIGAERPGAILRVMRPMAAGESRIWPVLENPEARRWRPIYQRTLPVVTLRLWYSDARVEHSEAGQSARAVLEPVSLPPTRLRRPAARRAKGRLARALTGRPTMAERCPVCYSKVERPTFHHPAALWCYEERVTEDDKQRQVRRHSNGVPDLKRPLIDPEPVHQTYLKIARSKPQEILSVMLSGFTQAGKSTWLLSLTGMMYYPAGNPRLLASFPASWGFNRGICSAGNVLQESEVNFQGQMEVMWIDGDVPRRNQEIARALRCPMFFETRRRGFISRRRRLMLIINDIAGEGTVKADVLAANKNFPHVGATTDVLYMVPAHKIATGDRYLEQFAAALGGVTFEGKALSPSDLNLVVGVSQVDRLRYGTVQQQELLNALLLPPYYLPQNPEPRQLQEYFENLKRVHSELESWLQDYTPALVKSAEQFASVRYCGFSAFGFQLIDESKRQDSEACLPFEPQPFRVIDPLFWLFQDHGLVEL